MLLILACMTGQEGHFYLFIYHASILYHRDGNGHFGKEGGFIPRGGLRFADLI
jgi:hypothetical protein